MAYIGISLHEYVLTTILDRGIGKIYHSSYFNNMSIDGVRKTLQRLEENNTLIRLARGYYLYPKRDPELGIIYPSIVEIANEIAKREKLRLIPTGDQALLQLGLSTQVPLKSIYLTDGGPRKIKVGKRMLVLKPTTPKMLALRGKTSTLVVQALKHLGKEKITPAILKKITTALKKENPIMAEADALLAPAWVREIIMDILKKQKQKKLS